MHYLIISRTITGLRSLLLVDRHLKSGLAMNG